MVSFFDFVAGRQGVYRTACVQRDAGGNAGLFFERFGPRYNGETSQQRDGSPSKECWVAAITGEHGDRAQLAAYRDRIAALVAANNGVAAEFRVGPMPFVTGMGLEHPIENGLVWHRTLGVPYVPGSSVKGMARAWAIDWADRGQRSEDAFRTLCLRVFGNERTVPSEDFRRGSVVFMDAVPVQKTGAGAENDAVAVEADVMTPHGKGSDAPKDAALPKPIHFAVVRSGSLFKFALLPAPGGAVLGEQDDTTGKDRHQVAREDALLAMQWVGEALARLGAGAKTKSGYGRFIAQALPPQPGSIAASTTS